MSGPVVALARIQAARRISTRKGVAAVSSIVEQIQGRLAVYDAPNKPFEISGGVVVQF